ncbi:DUF7683 domain-containing protein [Pseudochrobactrum lubricantis]|uniref:DUF7683 domain-containing protein n=1 Tax=Pseudochrobactrum lubricantis TaxID=558172 RepID=UPI0035E16FF2
MSGNVDYSAITWSVEIYEKDGDKFIKEYVIDKVSVSDIRRILNKNTYDSIFDTYFFDEEMANFFQNYIDEKIDLSKYDYFFGGYRK